LLLPFLPTPPRPREGHPEPAIDARGAPHTPIHLHPPLPSPFTSITIPPVAIVKPQEFSSREAFLPGGQPECTVT
jgi:FtsP/CotA-like multicopper oxidase with cupredoxin domain